MTAARSRPAYSADALGIAVATGVYGISFGVRRLRLLARVPAARRPPAARGRRTPDHRRVDGNGAGAGGRPGGPGGVPLLAALIVVQTLAGGERIVVDARVPALGVAALCVWRGAPFVVTVLAAAAVAAALRAL